MKVLLTLQDVEPAVRINALLEQDGVDTALVSPLDDIRSALKREKPDSLVFSGDLADPLWGILDMTPEGRGSFFPKVNYG